MALEGTRDRFRTAAWLYGAAGLVYVLDRVTKLVVEAELAGRPPIELIPGVLHLTFTENPGGAFSLFGGAPWLFFGASVVVAAIIVVASFRIGGALLPAAMGLVLGGALGNLTDRIVRGPGVSGKVVDFIDFQVWPVFNVADSAIVVGALLIVLAGAR
ncbi:MAG: signal peptidase II, partial [Actinobacteria bacterium]|nr:signal peptidase II [Actinomycetota bacterium]